MNAVNEMIRAKCFYFLLSRPGAAIIIIDQKVLLGSQLPLNSLSSTSLPKLFLPGSQGILNYIYVSSSSFPLSILTLASLSDTLAHPFSGHWSGCDCFWAPFPAHQGEERYLFPCSWAALCLEFLIVSPRTQHFPLLKCVP